MAILSWNEIKIRAHQFVNDWKNSAPNAREEADAQTFQTDFLNIFGVSRRQVAAAFESRVKIGGQADLFGGISGGHRGYIDLFWKGHIMIEMKSPGKDLAKAYQQAKEYAESLPPVELPVGILICDFVTFEYYDLEKGSAPVSFTLNELPQYVELFSDLAGYKDFKLTEADPVDIKAAEHMGELHDALLKNGYSGHELEMYLVRLLFCLFADDTGIFGKKKMFFEYIRQRTSVDGSDLALHLGMIFDTLNKDEPDRQKNLDEQLKAFRYINGGLFAERLETAAFNSDMRRTLIKCCALDWGQIKPEIFGAMFQSVKDKEKRRALGEHYTSETNILKLIKPLFLDNLRAEFEKIKAQTPGWRKQNLLLFHDKLCRLKFLDPACGCGNFLVVSYRELRLLEIDVLKEILGLEQILDIELMIRVNVNQFYGIEIEEFPARIAQTALWLMDHLMNNKASAAFGKYIARLPLTASPAIVIENALTVDWESIVSKRELSFILGNPPFLGSKIMTAAQRKEVNTIFEGIKNAGILDYVTCWYGKAVKYIQETQIEVAFVSTNSICQGEQVPVLWAELMQKSGIKINFAHQTFKWENEAKGKAAVYCVIIGFSQADRPVKKLYHYASVAGYPVESTVKQINAYLLDTDSVFITSKSNPICSVPKMNFGNMPLDGGNLLLSDEEKKEFVKIEPGAEKYIKPLISAREFLNNEKRWCLWLIGVEPSEIRKLPEIFKRVEAVKKFRLASVAPSTRDHAVSPSLFRDRNNPDTFIVVPRVSSENRLYIPMGFFDHNSIAGDTCMIIPDGTLYHFGILMSTMHMAWTRCVCGRLEMRYRYSKDIVYNNFPWPSKPTAKQITAIEKEAQAVLDARAIYPNSSLADLYDPVVMPPELVKAHQKLDKVVEAAYGKTFTNDADRVAHLFYLYQTLTESLIAKKAKRTNI
ncbi:methylase [Spirochaetia bacterium]|nr:methylase [Spirochaetia bacterium]